jgi:photosystem II stability/assembly factor-like uncharacterized protein
MEIDISVSRNRSCVLLPCHALHLLRVALFCFIATLLQMLPAQAPWTPVGPAGGDARALTAIPAQPNHLYLGSLDSWIYESLDYGASWHRLAKLDLADNLVLDNIVVDSANAATIYVGAWKLGQPGGGLWISNDGGKHWNEVDALRGQSIRALAQAPSNPRVLFAGTLEGVFRSDDAGLSWTLISPPGSREIHEVESLAVDPVDPDTLYAGTWHLPWKTTDGGRNWKNIKQGLIEDSDVFSIIVDPSSTHTIFLSACSGIYKSVNGGELFHKIAGIPSTARRTRVLMQDPRNRQIVYAGTTEGLYKTVDGGKTFTRMTGPNVIVNDVFVDPADPNHVLLATDRGGVLASRDGGKTFAVSNEGFSERTVDALLVDRGNPARVFAGVVNDKTYGGVFVSTNGGADWNQIDEGLDGRDVYALAQEPDGTVVAGTSRGIFALADNRTPGDLPHWIPKNTLGKADDKTDPVIPAGNRTKPSKKAKASTPELNSLVNAVDVSGDTWLASTSIGILTSNDHGASWQGGTVENSADYISVAAHGATLVGARSEGLVLSNDGGSTWVRMSVPAMLSRIHRIAFSSDGTLWLAAREGVFFTQDEGERWMWLERMPFRDVDDLFYDAGLGKVLVSSRATDWIYAIDPKALTWKWWRTGYRNGLVRAAGGRLVVASLDNGVLVGPNAGGIETGQK